MKKLIALLLLCPIFLLASCQSPVYSEADDFLLDTYITLRVSGGNAEDYLRLIREYDARFSPTSPTSEVFLLNQNKTADVSPETAELISEAIQYNKRTAGAFDSTVYPLLKLWGFTGEAPQVPDDEALSHALKRVGSQNISVSGARITLSNDAEFDPGGIAKGYISDKLYQAMQNDGVRSAIVSLGGNVVCIGSKTDGSPWTVGIASPFDPGSLIGHLKATDCFVITSGDYLRYFMQDGVRYHHILDPQTGRPAVSSLHSVTVVSAHGAEADALSTALFVMGTEKALAYAVNNKLRVILITEDTIYVSEGLSFSPVNTELKTVTIKAS